MIEISGNGNGAVLNPRRGDNGQIVAFMAEVHIGIIRQYVDGDGVSSGVDMLSAAATGASLTALTVTVTMPVSSAPAGIPGTV